MLKLIGLVLPLRADAADESTGLDLTMHGEEAYAQGSSAMLAGSSAMGLGAHHPFTNEVMMAK